MYYEDHGSREHPAVMCFHGVGMDHRTFAPQVSALKDRYRMITMDLPGHGASSDIPRDLPYSKTAASAALEILDHLDISQAVIIGQSLGSFVAQFAAALSPQRVTASVHIGGGALYPRYSPLLRLLKPMMALNFILIPQPLLTRMFARHKALLPETRKYLREITSRNGKKIIFRLTSAMLQEMTEGTEEPLNHPVLLLCGDHDLKFIKNLSLKWHAGISGSRFVLVDNAHHIANQDNPEGMNQHLQMFLEEVYQR